MINSKYNRILSILLLSALTASTACGASSTDTYESDKVTTEAVETLAHGYVYPTADYNNYEFSFLNSEYLDWANVTIAPEQTSGDLVSDALFERNSRIEERYNITIKEYSAPIGELAAALIKNVSAGDDAYDTYIIPLHLASGVLADNYLLDLNEVETLNIDKPWWDQKVNSGLELGGKLMLTSSDISLFPFEATWVVYFNEDMMTNLGLELPYQLVRDGKWTLDKLTEYAKAGALLNGDDGFNPYKADGRARYGLTTHSLILSLVHSSGSSFAGINDGSAYFEADSERMFTLYEKIAKLTDQSAGAYFDRDAASPIIDLFGEFRDERFMMWIDTLGHISRMRDFDMSFGVLPLPKLDESQESYHSLIAVWGSGMTGIASTAADANRTGVILDALAYDSCINLMEPYYNAYLTQKGLRNEDSADMLKIVRESRGVATDVVFGWTTDLKNSLNSLLSKGNADVASAIASRKAQVLESINKTLEKMVD